jgi:hypothetical protein
MASQIVFETHCTTEDNEKGVATGWLPGRLSATGREQAAALGRRRRHDGLAGVLTSDLGRAREGDVVNGTGTSLAHCRSGDRVEGRTSAAPGWRNTP